ncbi:MAG: AAA family ATPase [Anaerolineae bacterium]
MILIRRVAATDFKQLESIDLRLPRRGRILVRGLNEAGKSTLFEAVFFALFGRPLASGSGHARLDDVIRYGTDEARVELDVEVSSGASPRVLSLRRVVRRGRPNTWELDVVAPDGSVEEVRGNRVVNERVESELGLDGDALLDTCFVEQKKLEKLEGMSRAQREQSLMRLFNLDRLLEIADQLKVRHGDEAAVLRLDRRAELAELQASIPDLRTEHASLAAAHERATARDELRDLSVRLGDLEGARSELADARKSAEALRARAADAERALAAATFLREARTARDLALGSETEAARLQSLQDAAKAARDEELRIVERGKAIGRLARRHECLVRLAAERERLLEAVSAADQRLVEVARDRESLNEARQGLADARARGRDLATAMEELAGDARAFDVRDAMRDLLDAQDALAAQGLASGRADDVAAARHAREDAARARYLQSGAAAVIAVALLTGSLLADGMLQVALMAAAIAVSALLAWRWLVASRHIEGLAVELGRLEAADALRGHEILRHSQREEGARQRLRELNAIAPSTAERALAALEHIDARLGERTREDVTRAMAAAREMAALTTAEAATLAERQSELARRSGRVDAAALGDERDSQATRAARLAGLLERRAPQLEDQARTLSVTRDPAVLERELGALREALKTARETARQEQELARRAADARRTAAERWAQAERGWTAAADGLAIGEWSQDLDDEGWDAAAAALADAYKIAGGDAVRSGAEQAAARAGSMAGALGANERAFDADFGSLAERLARLNVAEALEPVMPSADAARAMPSADAARATPSAEAAQATPAALEAARATSSSGAARATPAALEAAADLLERMTPEPSAAIATKRDAVHSELTAAIGVSDRLARELGLEGEHLDAEATAAERDSAMHALAVRRYAADIANQAGRNVIRRVLPQTIEHMRGLLPLLTQGRYFDVQLSDDYRIEVYDERAGAWRQKAIFSGGARDQMSLTLRLAFALATLPEERGARPGFLFLDEPLGAFDEERAAALISLLTEGEIADSFDQVFLISHVRVDEGQFDYRITMADGKVVDSTLPEQPSAA